MDCSICGIHENILFKCIDEKCNTFTCVDCLSQYFDFCIGDNLLPKCTGELCISYIIKKTIENPIIQNSKVSEEEIEEEESEETSEKVFEGLSFQVKCELIEKYKKVINNFLSLKEQKLKEEKDIIKLFIEKKRKEKLEYIDKGFPKAVNTLLKIALTKKLNRINDEKLKVKNNILKIKKYFKKCNSYVCDGYLVNNICSKCNLEYCSKCDLVLKENQENHECKIADIESALLLRKMTKCPKCGIPVEKISGCDYLLCPSNTCKTSFFYSTGEVNDSNHGGQNKEVKIKEHKKLSEIYNKLPKEIFDRILLFEHLEPKEQIIEDEKKLTYKNFDKMVLNNLQNKKYFIFRSQIEQKCLNNDINETYLDEVIKLVS